MKRFELYFYGYTWEEYVFQISSLKGIFVIYHGGLDLEGSVDIKDLLYIGYHNGIIALYEDGVMDSIKKFVKPGNRIFLSYAEMSTNEDGELISSLIIQAANPKYKQVVRQSDLKNAIIIIKGNCKFIPEEIII